MDSVLDMDVIVPPGGARSMTEAAFRLIGTFAEESTHTVATAGSRQ